MTDPGTERHSRSDRQGHLPMAISIFATKIDLGCRRIQEMAICHMWHMMCHNVAQKADEKVPKFK
jgi:hypothetical protein